MIRFTTLVLLCTIAANNFYAQQYGTYTDVRDGKGYRTIQIGNQVWIAENLQVDKFRNGDVIPQAKTSAEWERAGNMKQPAWCYYTLEISAKKTEVYTTYGKLYNWYAVNDPRGLAPEGWRIPSYDDWTSLTDYLGGVNLCGNKLKFSSGWSEGGTNSSGFIGLPGGSRNEDGTFGEIGERGFWWSSTEINPWESWLRILGSDEKLDKVGWGKGWGLSVRCIKN